MLSICNGFETATKFTECSVGQLHSLPSQQLQTSCDYLRVGQLGGHCMRAHLHKLCCCHGVALFTDLTQVHLILIQMLIDHSVLTSMTASQGEW